MKDFADEVKTWREELGLSAPEGELDRRLCQPQIRPIIERIMMLIRPVSEVQMIRRNLIISKLKIKTSSEETNVCVRQPKNGEIRMLQNKYKAIEAEIQKKMAQQLVQKRKIESLKAEIKQKYRKTSSLQHEICVLKELAFTVNLVSKQLLKNSRQQCDSNCFVVDLKNATQEKHPALSETSLVSIFTATQEKAIISLKMSDVSAPPVPVGDKLLHFQQIESNIQKLLLGKQMQDYNCLIEIAVDNLLECMMHTLPDSVNQGMVREWAKLQVKQKKSDVLSTALKDMISVRGSSLRSDRDYLRVVLLNAEKKLQALSESYKNAQKELVLLAKDLSHGWQCIEEAAEKARSKHLQLEIDCKETHIRLSELTDKWRLTVSVELQILHENMKSLIVRDATDEISDFGVTYNDLFCVLNLVAQKRVAKHVKLNLPTMFILSDDTHLEHLISMKSNETHDSEESKKVSNLSDWKQHMDVLLSNKDHMIQSLRDLIALWWQPPFERAVPENLVVNGKNILQHTAHWDRLTSFLEDKDL